MVELEDKINKYFDLSKIGHAYLIKTNDYSNVIQVAKKILKLSNISEPNLENLINKGIYSDLIIIEADGQWIKKEQILNLKNSFKTKSSYNGMQIYIIKNAENLNKSSGNTLLKFLEEPEENIVALLITENKNKVLETIVSRCQYIVLDSNEKSKEECLKNHIDIIEIIEEKQRHSNLDVFNYIEKLNDKKEIKDFFVNLINIYDMILLKKIDKNFTENRDNEIFDKISKNSTIEDIKKRIDGLILVIDSLEYNINIKLLVDKLIISMFGVD